MFEKWRTDDAARYRSPLMINLTGYASLWGLWRSWKTVWGWDDISALADRFSGGKVKSADLIKILGAALRAGGADISDSEAALMHCKGGATALTCALVTLLRETFGPELEEGNPQPQQASKELPSNGGGKNKGLNPTQADLV